MALREEDVDRIASSVVSKLDDRIGGQRKPKRKFPTRDQVRVEVWEERDRLHIGIQDKETGYYYASWWDDDARQMFEDGFFQRVPNLERSVLDYAEDMGILAK